MPAVDQLSYSALEAYARCGYRFYVERVLGLPPSPLPGTGGRSAGLAAADRGTLAHGLLERLDLDGPAPDAADAHALAAAQGLELSADEAAELAGLVDRFARSGIAARLRAASDVRREARFAFVLEPAGVLVAGAMDVLAQEGEQTLVVDYKSDRLEGRDPDAVVEAEYATQRVVYALAALRAGAGRVEIAHCFLERPDEPAEARFGAADVPALEAGLGDARPRCAGRQLRGRAQPARRAVPRLPGQDHALFVARGDDARARAGRVRPARARSAQNLRPSP